MLQQADAIVGEGPLWDPMRNVMWWVDTPRGVVHAYDPASGGCSVMTVGSDVGSVALHDDGGLVLLLRGRVARCQPESGTTTTIVTIEADQPTRFLNDSGVDPAGRLWVGCVDDEELPGTSSYYRVENGVATRLLTGLTLANGVAWSPDGRWMYTVDSSAGTVWVHAYDVDSGSVGEKRALWTGAERHGLPDGIAVDQSGDIWVAFWGGGCVRLLAPDGAVRATIDLPVGQVSSCAFGGPDLSDLYITSARFGMDAAACADAPLAGSLFRVAVDTPGLAIPRYAG